MLLWSLYLKQKSQCKTHKKCVNLISSCNVCVGLRIYMKGTPLYPSRVLWSWSWYINLGEHPTTLTCQMLLLSVSSVHAFLPIQLMLFISIISQGDKWAYTALSRIHFIKFELQRVNSFWKINKWIFSPYDLIACFFGLELSSYSKQSCCSIPLQKLPPYFSICRQRLSINLCTHWKGRERKRTRVEKIKGNAEKAGERIKTKTPWKKKPTMFLHLAIFPILPRFLLLGAFPPKSPLAPLPVKILTRSVSTS